MVRVRVRVLGLWFFVRVRVSVSVSVTGSGSYLNENFVIIYRLCCHLVSVPEKPLGQSTLPWPRPLSQRAMACLGCFGQPSVSLCRQHFCYIFSRCVDVTDV